MPKFNPESNLSMSKKKGENAPTNKADPCASNAAELALLCDNSLSYTLTLSMAMKAVGYSHEETQNRTLQMLLEIVRCLRIDTDDNDVCLTN